VTKVVKFAENHKCLQKDAFFVDNAQFHGKCNCHEIMN